MLSNYKNAVDSLQAPEDLKQRTAQMMKQPFEAPSHKFPIGKAAACLAMVGVIVLGVMTVPRILKPVVTVAPAAQSELVSSFVSSSQANKVNNVYHDDEIQNILVLHLEKYKDDTFHADTVVLVSVDKRHSKLKVTSLSSMHEDAYTLGKAPLVIKTIENNFGLAIDNYVILDDTAIEKTFDRLGSVTTTITPDQAKLYNTCSGYSGPKLSAGTVKLTSKQLMYFSELQNVKGYSEIPTSNLISSLIEKKVKSSNTGEINQFLNDTFSLATTDMKKDSLLQLTSTLLSLRYPIINNRVPSNSALDNLQADKQLLIKDIYEDEFVLPKGSNTEKAISRVPSNAVKQQASMGKKTASK